MTARETRRDRASTVSRRRLLKAVGAGGAAVSLSQVWGLRVADAQTAGDTLQTIVNTAITAEALATTLVYGVVTQSTYFSRLPAIHQDVLRATLTTEQVHFDLLAEQGGTPATTQFFMPADILESPARLVQVGDFLETVCIGAYLAATRRFAELNQPVLAEVAHQLGGSEAEHRVLIRAMGRDVLGLQLIPNNIPIERPVLQQVSQAPQFLAPFLRGGEAFGVGFVGPMTLPPRNQVLAAGAQLEPVPTALRAFRK